MVKLNRLFTDAMDLAIDVLQRLLELPASGVALGLIVLAALLVLGWVLLGKVRGRARPLRKPVFVALVAVGALSYAFLLDQKLAQLRDEVRQLDSNLRFAALRADAKSSAGVEGPGGTGGPAGTGGKGGARFFALERALRKLDERFGTCELTVQNLDAASDLAGLRFTGPDGPVVAFVALVDLTHPGLSIRITPEHGPKILTSTFAKSEGATLAVNGEAGTSPTRHAELGQWQGNWIVRGNPILLADTDERPFLSFDREGHGRYFAASIVDVEVTDEKYDTLWGRFDLLVDGEIVQHRGKRNRMVAPRTLMALDQRGETLYLMVVDGRQPGYSVGMSLMDGAYVLQALGAFEGMSCDEGGSSTLFAQRLGGLVNRPSAGYERPVYSHFGVVLADETSESVAPAQND